MKIKFLKFFKFVLLLFLLLSVSYFSAVFCNQFYKKDIEVKSVNMPLIQLSEQLLLHVKTKQETQTLEKELSSIPMSDLKRGLPNDNAKKTFWVNIYNAYYQLLYTREQKRNPEIFTEKLIPIAHIRFCLDDVEHGILRKYRWKYSLGYLENIFESSLIKDLAVDTIDYRIHFALNCGAKSCPPIAFYQYEKINEQLDKATRSFLLAETEIDEAKKKIITSKILSWFSGDFGGKKGIKSILSNLFQQNLSDYALHFKDYDWTEAMANFEE